MVVALTGCGAHSGPAPGPIVFFGHPGDELGGGYNNLMVMNPDGTGVRRLTRTDGDIAPSWSPDGTKVVYARANSYTKGCNIGACSQIWIVDADGTDEQRLTSVSARSEAPDWSPDGDRIAFHQWNVPYDYDTGGIDIYVMNVDGSGRRPLTTSGGSEDPAWSPDGDRIAFTRVVGENEEDLYVMNADGQELRRLTYTAEPEYSPVWSPDGEEIAFTRRRYDGVLIIVVINDEGSQERTLFPPDARLSCGSRDVGEPEPRGCVGNGGPAWSPDGTQIAFIRGGVWVMDADGGNPHELPAGPYADPQGLDWTAAPD